MSACRRDFDKIKCLSLLVKEKNLLKNLIKYQKKALDVFVYQQY